jgi:hypothetical protein
MRHFKKGDKVRCLLHGAGCTSEESAIVCRIEGDKVWVGNTYHGSKAPFVAGRKEGVFGFWEEIIPAGGK